MTKETDKAYLIKGANILSAALARATAEAEQDLTPFPPATRTACFRPRAAFVSPVRAQTYLATDRSIEVDFAEVGGALQVTVYSVGPNAMRRHAGQEAELRSLDGAFSQRFTFNAYGQKTFEIDAEKANDALAHGFDIEVERKWEDAK